MKQKMIKTDIIVVSYKDQSAMDKCMASVKEHCKDYNLIIEDNNPPNPNRGFTKAVNDGIKKGNAPYIFLLNQDAIILYGCIETLIERMENHNKIGIVGPMQLDPNDQNRIAWGGSAQCFPGGIHKGGLLSMGHCQIPEKQKWINGAAMLIRRKMLDEIGLLDENLFLLYSDSDISYVSRRLGWECWFEPRARVLHTLGKASKNSQELAQKDMVAFMKKWGITTDGKGNFFYSREFALLDTLP